MTSSSTPKSAGSSTDEAPLRGRRRPSDARRTLSSSAADRSPCRQRRELHLDFRASFARAQRTPPESVSERVCGGFIQITETLIVVEMLYSVILDGRTLLCPCKAAQARESTHDPENSQKTDTRHAHDDTRCSLGHKKTDQKPNDTKTHHNKSRNESASRLGRRFAPVATASAVGGCWRGGAGAVGTCGRSCHLSATLTAVVAARQQEQIKLQRPFIQ